MVLYLIIFLIIVAIAGIVYILKFGKRESRAIMKETPREIQPAPTFKIVQKQSFLEKQKEIQPSGETMKSEIPDKTPSPNDQQSPKL
ncbi:MAG: hypothetical protein Q8O39_00370 [bacterium]|nr:hypothetical protein [bacterium]